jgi:hypothetical protein
MFSYRRHVFPHDKHENRLAFRLNLFRRFPCLLGCLVSLLLALFPCCRSGFCLSLLFYRLIVHSLDVVFVCIVLVLCFSVFVCLVSLLVDFSF